MGEAQSHLNEAQNADGKHLITVRRRGHPGRRRHSNLPFHHGRGCDPISVEAQLSDGSVPPIGYIDPTPARDGGYREYEPPVPLPTGAHRWWVRARSRLGRIMLGQQARTAVALGHFSSKERYEHCQRM